MLKFRNRSITPAGGFRYKNAETGYEISSHNYHQWIGDIAAHRKANALAPVSEEAAQDQNCRRMAPATSRIFCEGHTYDPVVDGISLKLADIMHGTEVLARFKLSGSPLVSQEEAERRAGICVKCPMNTDYLKPCSAMCEQLVRAVKAIVGDVATSFDDKLKACAVCKCANVAQVHLRAEELQHGVTPEMMEQFPADICWKRKAIEALVVDGIPVPS